MDLWLELGKPAADLPSLNEVTTQALRDYFMARLLGNCNIYTTQNITGGTAAVSGIFTKSAIYLDTRRPITTEAPEYDPSARAWELNINAGYAKGLVRSTYGVKFTADASEPS